MVRPQVHSTKHYVQFPFNQIAAGVIESNFAVISVDVLDKNLNADVEQGCTIKAIYIEFWLQNEGNLSEFIATVSKNPENGTGPTFLQHADLMTYVNKKNVLYTTQGLTPNDAISGPIAILRNYIKIPKSKQRFGLGDTLTINISNVSLSDLNRCGFCTYKEYT